MSRLSRTAFKKKLDRQAENIAASVAKDMAERLRPRFKDISISTLFMQDYASDNIDKILADVFSKEEDSEK